MWVEKHKPKRFIEFRGNGSVVEGFKRYNWRKPILLHGAPGTGKSTIVEIAGRELGYEIVEITNENISKAGAIAETSSLFGSKKLIVIDNVEKIRKIKDVGQLAKTTKNPLVLITSDASNRRLKTLKTVCESVGIRRMQASSMANLLGEICRKEVVTADRDILFKIAENSGGDIRAAINDLETIAKGRERICPKDLEILESRDMTVDIYRVLSKIFGAKSMKDAIESTWDLKEQPETTMLWIDENVPQIYRGRSELEMAMHNLSRADIFMGRISNRQYWGFLRYANPLMTAGVNIAKAPGPRSYVRYQFPSYLSKMGRTKGNRSLEKSIGEKLGPVLHVSRREIAESYIPLYRLLLKKKLITEETLENLDLEGDEIDYIAKAS